MTPQAINDAAELLALHYRDGGVIDGLPPALRPASRADGYAIQAALPHDGLALYGWKIAATSKAGQAHIGVSRPQAGRLFHERRVANGGALPLGANRMRVAEVEFAFRFGRDLVPRSEPYAVGEVLAAVASLHPAIEIPDSRYVDFATAGEAQLIADNACAHRFVSGEATGADWRAIDLSAFRPRGGIAGVSEVEGSGSNVLGDPRLALTWLANELSSLGRTLRAGETVITGTCLTPIPIAAGTLVYGDFGELGRVSVRIA